jgi:MYXO-CTERM domain-containing protein
MKSVIASLVAVAGMSVAANAVVNTNITWQTSANGTDWAGGLRSYAPGTQVMARALVTYTGTGTPFGLASFVFQPTVSNFTAADTVSAFINGGVGSNTSTPPGVLIGSAQANDTTSFGRLSPWGRSATSSTSAIRGFFHTNPNGDGINYLRIAQSQVTSWIGGGGNTTGGSGVNIAQLSNVGRTTSDPAFEPGLTNVYVFKFGFTLDPANSTRPDLVIDAPLAGFGNRNTASGDREVYWWADMNEASGSNRGTALVTTAQVHVTPTPASLALLGLGGLAVGRRRR